MFFGDCVSESTSRSSSLNPFLKMAATAGIERAVQVHIDRGDDLNARDATGRTPLMLSAARNRALVCKLLLDAGADNELLDASGRTAFAIAIAAGASEAAAVFESASASDGIRVGSTSSRTSCAWRCLADGWIHRHGVPLRRGRDGDGRSEILRHHLSIAVEDGQEVRVNGTEGLERVHEVPHVRLLLLELGLHALDDGTRF